MKTNKTKILTRLALGALILTSTSGCGNEFSTGLAVGAGLGVAAGVIVTVAVMSPPRPAYYASSNYVSSPSSNAVTGTVVTGSTPNPKPTPTPTPVPTPTPTPVPTPTPTPVPTPTPTPTPIIVYVPAGTTPVPTPTPSPTPTPAPAITCSGSGCPEVMVKPPTTRDAFQEMSGRF